MTGRDKKVDLLYTAGVINSIMMNQRAARRFDDADTLVVFDPPRLANVRPDDVRIIKDLLDSLQRIQNLDQTCRMIMERAAARIFASRQTELASSHQARPSSRLRIKADRARIFTSSQTELASSH